MPLEILIVDDDRNFIDTLRDGLSEKQPGISVTVAASAHEGLEALSRSVPSAIILDVQLPDMHGTEFLRTLKGSSKLRGVPVVFISARYTEPADRAEAIMAGAGAFFTKPVDIEDLWKELKYLLDKKNKP